MAIAALIVSVIALGVSTWLALRQQRWHKQVVSQEQRDRKEQLALQRHVVEYDEKGWRRWGRFPPKPPDS